MDVCIFWGNSHLAQYIPPNQNCLRGNKLQFFPQWKAWIILSAIVLRCQWAAAAFEGKVQWGPGRLLLTSSLGRKGVVNIWCCFKTHILLILISSLPSFLHTAILGVFLKHSPDQSFIFIKIIIDFSFLQTKSRFPAWHPSPLMILILTHLGLNPTLQFAALCTQLVFPWSHVNALRVFSLSPFSGRLSTAGIPPSRYKHFAFTFLIWDVKRCFTFLMLLRLLSA